MSRSQLATSITSGKALVLAAFLMLPLAMGLQAAQAAEPAAVLAVVAGDVVIHRGDENFDGSFGAALQSGDVVETGDDAQAAVLFESGQIIELGPGSRITVSGVPSQEGSEAVAQVPDALSGSLDRFAQTDSGEEGLSALPTLRSGADSDVPQPTTPRSTRVAPAPVTLQWTEVEDVLEYRVTLSGPDNQRHTEGTSQTSWSPEVALQPGEQWSWNVSAITEDGEVQSDEVVFEVGTEEQGKELAGLNERLAPLLASDDVSRENTARFLLGSYSRSAGFYGEAIQHFEKLVESQPERQELHRELGSLYQIVGRHDRAAEEYKLALRE